METQNGAQNQLRETLALIADPSLPSSRRRELEGWLDAHSSVTAQNACMAVQSLDVANDSQLYWYYISCLERHAGRLFWTLSSEARMKLLNDVESLLNSCLHISSPLTRKVFSLHTTVLCWGASEQNESAAAALLDICAPLSDRYRGEKAQDWQLKLERTVVLMDDLQSGLLRPDANSAGILPAVCLTTLRGLFFSELQKRICGLALLAVKGAAAQARGEQQAQQQQSATAARNLVLGLDLLGKVLPTVTTAGTLPVTATDLVEVCIPHLSSTAEDEAEAALRAVSSICGLPMVPSERAMLQKRLLTLLASSQELLHRPLMRARVARAVVENSGMNLLKLDQETCSVMHIGREWNKCSTHNVSAVQSLLANVAEEARQRTSAQEVLCCLELWMLWLSRYAELSDSNFQLDSARQDMEWCIAPFRESAGTVIRTLLQCLVRMNETASTPVMAVTAEALHLEAYSGAAMEEELSPLCIAETGTAADIEDSAAPGGASDSTVVVQSSEDLCMALSAHSTSEHGVFCACLENVVAHAVSLCGPVSAASVWECASAALRSRGDVIVSAAGAAGERTALDVHVVARLASRCTHELHTCSVGVVLGFASTMVDWVTAVMQKLSQDGFGGAQKPVMIAAGAVFKALSALASLWAPEVLHGTASEAPDASTQTFGFLSSLFNLSMSTIHCVLITLPNIASHIHTAATAAANAPNEVQMNEEAQYLASCASEALLAASHISIGNMNLTHDQVASLQHGGPVRALTDVCMHLATAPQQGVGAAQGLGVLPERVQRDAWVAFADLFATWPSRVRDMPADQWQVVTSELRTALTPFLSSWGEVRTHVTTGGTQGADSSNIQWEQTAGVFKRLCTCLASLLSCVGYLPGPARACVYNAVAPAVEAALDILEVAHRCGAHRVGLDGSRLLVAVVHSVLKEMPVEVVKRMMAVSATAPQGGDALPAQQQVVRLVWRVTDEASNSVASLLPQAMSFLLTTLDSCTLEQLASSAPLAACARQCLCGIMHMLAHRYQAMVAADVAVKGAPCTTAQRFATFLEAAAAGKVASVHPQDLRELLEEFFDMQRVTGLYKQAEFKHVRMLLEKGLMAMLLNPIADGAKEQLIDVLWGVGSTDWDEFVGTFLVQFCSICSELVQQRTEALIRPFTDQSGSLHDFPHFSSCMDSLLNDLRFFEKLSAAGASPAKEE